MSKGNLEKSKGQETVKRQEIEEKLKEMLFGKMLSSSKTFIVISLRARPRYIVIGSNTYPRFFMLGIVIASKGVHTSGVVPFVTFGKSMTVLFPW